MTNKFESYKKRCHEWEIKSENDEKRFLMLELEVEDLKNKNKVLEGKIMKIREVVEVSDGEDEVEKFYALMTELKVLECEKQKAESEVFKLKEKVNELMSRVYELESSLNEKAKEDVNAFSRSSSKVRKRLPFEDDGCSSKKMAPSTTGVAQTPFSGVIDISDEKAKEDVNVVSRSRSKVKKRLPFEDDGCSSKKMAPSTPGVAQTPFSGVIDISDEDENNDETPENKNISDSSNTAAFNKINLEDYDEEYFGDRKFRCSNSKRGKRKRAAKIIRSDEETGDNETTYDDNAQPHSSRPVIDSEDEVTEGASKRRLTRLRTLRSKNNIIRSDKETSDNETTYNDNAQPHGSRPKIDSEDEVTEGASKRRLTRLRNLRSKNNQETSRVNQNKTVSIDENSSCDEDDADDVQGSESEEESMRNFINDSPEIVSESESASESSDNTEQPHSSRPKIDSEDEVTEGPSKRRLTRLRNLESKKTQDTSGVNQNKTVSIDENSSSEDEDDADDVQGSESEEESMHVFINDSPEIVSESESASESGDNSEEPENVLNDYKEAIENIGRKKVSNYKWELQGEMQADFGKDPELCMRAVCALYRQQTEDEKASKETIHHNERGFSHLDAYRGSKLVEFLMDGEEDLKKTVKELEMYDSKGVELCRSLALKYSKQLFQIYQNKEDPYFLP